MNDKTEQTLRALLRLLESDAHPTDFPACCRRLGVVPGPLNEVLLDELGVSGEELVGAWPNLICDWSQK